jgi:hypothetical protein
MYLTEIWLVSVDWIYLIQVAGLVTECCKCGNETYVSI